MSMQRAVMQKEQFFEDYYISRFSDWLFGYKLSGNIAKSSVHA